MRKQLTILWGMLGAALSLLIVSNAVAVEYVEETETVEYVALEEDVVKTADNAIILFDASESMAKKYRFTTLTRYDMAKQELMARNTRLPNLGYNIGLYLYNKWTPLYPVQPFDRVKMADAIEKMPDKASGPTLLRQALLKLDPILATLSGRTVVFVFTDGTYFKGGKQAQTPAQIAETLAAKYDVCFYVISTADDAASRATLERVAEANFCSRAISFQDFIERPDLHEGALYTTRISETVDLIANRKLVGVSVNNILFDWDKADVRTGFHDELEALGTFLKKNPNAYAILSGFTDNTGDPEYNDGLSLRRAESVATYLVTSFNIERSRLVLQWFGALNPEASNTTAEGRALNRRVVIGINLAD